ncbi:BgtA-21553 [Blumeria graminis f. sp. tritici]|uniref:BgtA-21553 n=2 Tax=Blumeria graminis f. sp. tritici TaxID=62690 RepID=A0A9X9MLY7_BLUGR|nr:hypothetical protein BGT96224_A21553 [Blumeria graminis f. sp. tritici 96224]VDB92969.1 BgtA-21553 [Blumeria graminis f. sp. tritici]
MTGILGGINNNTTLEMGFEKEDRVRDMSKRAYSEDMIGFICCGRTAHSEDAGKSRRVASYTRVRILSNNMIRDTFGNAAISNVGEWVVYCMGIICNTDQAGICTLVELMNARLRLYNKSQFSYPDNWLMEAPPTYIVCYEEKILCISIAPGVLLRTLPDSTMVDSSMYHYQPPNPIWNHMKIPSSSNEYIQYKYSAFFMMCPYLTDDRPPRTLLASGQTVQAMCFSWAPATAKVSLVHASSPLVSTTFVRRIEEDWKTNADAMWDIVPGEDMLVCFANLPLNYDDSMIFLATGDWRQSLYDAWTEGSSANSTTGRSAYNSNGSSMVADIYIAVESIISRQTVEQILESHHAMNAIGDCSMKDVAQDSAIHMKDCSYLIDGITGEVIESVLPSGEVVEVSPSIGFIRVHASENKHSLWTSSGRAAGRVVATSEMDFHAMFSSGMYNCAQELLNRDNIVRVQICIVCKRIQVLCECGVENATVPTRLSYDTVIFDILSACINGSANTYEHLLNTILRLLLSGLNTDSLRGQSKCTDLYAGIKATLPGKSQDSTAGSE